MLKAITREIHIRKHTNQSEMNVTRNYGNTDTANETTTTKKLITKSVRQLTSTVYQRLARPNVETLKSKQRTIWMEVNAVYCLGLQLEPTRLTSIANVCCVCVCSRIGGCVYVVV